MSDQLNLASKDPRVWNHVISKVIIVGSIVCTTLSCVSAGDTREEMDKYDDEQVVRMLLSVWVGSCKEVGTRDRLACYVNALDEAANAWKAARNKAEKSSAALDELVAVKDNGFVAEYAEAFYWNPVPSVTSERAKRFAVWKIQHLHAEHPIR